MQVQVDELKPGDRIASGMKTRTVRRTERNRFGNMVVWFEGGGYQAYLPQGKVLKYDDKGKEVRPLTP